MSESKFTPGPWSVGRGYEISHAIKGWKYYPIHYGHDEENVCDIVYNKADAELIAAAPEMYAELERIEDILEDSEDCGEISLDRIKSILRKARGESEVKHE